MGRPRSRSEVAAFFDRLEPVTPGVVPLPEWRDETEASPRPPADEVSMYAGVARKR
ncbi:SAM-dependent methyltransferase [Paractinoplanes maris]|uniref:SAM-dependent methyltransferase n=1 Tax=Paractinoplanes maris TaxID=1734446 RepID=UPI0020209A05|nr:SAM-dependent methyltransferase [Actinoplanes maris]